MGSGTFYPGVDADDGYKEGANFRAAYDWIGIGNSGSVCEAFIRFPSVTIPQGATITAAFIRFTCFQNQAVTTVRTNIYFNDIDTAVAPTNVAEHGALVNTTAFVAWDSLAAWTDGTTYDTPSIITPLQEIVDRGGFANGNAVMVLIEDDSSDVGAYRLASDISQLAGVEKAELHVSWDSNISATCATLTLTENRVQLPVIGATTVALTLTTFSATVSPDVYIEAETATLTLTTYRTILDVDVACTSVSLMVATYQTTVTLVLNVSASLATLSLTTYTADVDFLPSCVINETVAINDQVAWQWGLVFTESLVATDTVSERTGWTLSEWLTLRDTLTDKWVGNWEIEDKLQLFGESIICQVFNDTALESLDVTDAATFLHKMVDTIAESLGFTEEVLAKMNYKPTVTETLAIVGAVEILNTLNNTVEESLAATDEVTTGWINSITETLAVTDEAIIKWYAMDILTESLALTEEVLCKLQISDTVSETLNLAATLALKHLLNDIVVETLHFGVIVELDDEVWECWVLNTNKFHASIYSGYQFNSFAVYNNTAYGCKTGGVYTLTGDTDDETEIISGIILPETNFGTTRGKRFRKAWFGLSGGTTPVLRVETDTGNMTYTISSSKVNMGRDMAGKKWVLSVQDFDDLDFIELIPIILTR